MRYGGMADYPPTIAFRIPEGLVKYMDRDIMDNKEHKNRTEYIVTALREYEERRELLKKANGGGGKQFPRESGGLTESEGSDGGMKDGQ